jgi:hypothetical protein
MKDKEKIPKIDKDVLEKQIKEKEKLLSGKKIINK